MVAFLVGNRMGISHLTEQFLGLFAIACRGKTGRKAGSVISKSPLWLKSPEKAKNCATAYLALSFT